MSKVITTSYRKLSKSVSQRGLLVTGVRCVTRPARRALDSLQWMSPAFRRIRREHAEWDRLHRVDTGPGNQAGWLAEIDSENWTYGRGYHPAPSESLIERLRDLAINYEEFTFIDFGSGKGRSLFAASNFSFKSIIGVEYNLGLHRTALENVQTYRCDEQQCFEIQPVHCDASTYEIPSGPMVYYFYDPFAEPVMKPVVDAIFEKLNRDQQKCYIVYYNPVFAEYFEDSSQFKRVAQGAEFENYWRRTCEGNKDANEFTSELKDHERYVVYEANA